MKIVGSLPNLEVLKLQSNAFRGTEWNSTEGEFQRLKYMMIRYCKLVTWRADSSCFPTLERLDLFGLELEEIPEGIGEVMSLELIKLSRCRMSLVISAKKILEEQQSLGNDDLVIQVADVVVSDEEKEELQSFKSDHFQVQVLGGFA